MKGCHISLQFNFHIRAPISYTRMLKQQQQHQRSHINYINSMHWIIYSRAVEKWIQRYLELLRNWEYSAGAHFEAIEMFEKWITDAIVSTNVLHLLNCIKSIEVLLFGHKFRLFIGIFYTANVLCSHISYFNNTQPDTKMGRIYAKRLSHALLHEEYYFPPRAECYLPINSGIFIPSMSWCDSFLTFPAHERSGFFSLPFLLVFA